MPFILPTLLASCYVAIKDMTHPEFQRNCRAKVVLPNDFLHFGKNLHDQHATKTLKPGGVSENELRGRAHIT